MRRSVLGQSPWKHSSFLESSHPAHRMCHGKDLYTQLHHQRLSYLPPFSKGLRHLGRKKKILKGKAIANMAYF